MGKNTRIADVKDAMIEKMDLGSTVTRADLIVANHKYGKITDMFEDTTSCDDIDQDREWTMVYHVPN